jgi:DNA-binding SARP family transcriptional activator/predicted ATPase
MAKFKLFLFGTPRVTVDGDFVQLNLRKGLALLAYVAVTRCAHSRDALATLLWPEKDQQSARANLRRTLYELSRLLGESLLDAAAETIALDDNAPLWIDTEHFQKCLAQHLPAAPASKIDSAKKDAARPARLVEAVELYSADFMAGFTLPDCPEFDEWQFFQREALRSSFAGLVQHLVLLHEAEAQWEEAARYARRWLALDPLEEAVHRRLMQLYAQAGQAGAALRQFEECARILDEELGVSPEAETTALFEAIRSRRFPTVDRSASRAGHPAGVVGEQVSETIAVEPPAVTVGLAAANTVPVSTTPFVGRRQELAELLRRLRDPHCRLLTLVGPGGIGKTRLASEVVAAIRNSQAGSVASEDPPYFEDGSFFVPLQPVNAASGIVSAIAGALRLQFYSGTPAQEQLSQFLREKELLLALDNFEHLLAGAGSVAEILAAAPRVKVLVTSREALKLHEEWFHPLAGMRLPPSPQLQQRQQANRGAIEGGEAGNGDSDNHVADYDAIQLFIQTARRAQPAFDPASQMAEIVRICRLVDGMPLAIELAASWLKVLSCEQIAGEIEGGIDILVTRHQNVPARHRSMRVVLEHSWQLLGEEAQRVLKRLSVFRGGFLQDAAAVAGANLLTLADLVDKSWIYRTPGGRYQIHELLRQYAADRLAEAAHEEAEMQDRHATFYLRQVAELEAALIGPEQPVALDRIGEEVDNVLAAWARAVAVRSFDLIDSSLHALYFFFHTRSRYVEGEELFRNALRQVETDCGSDGEAEKAPFARDLALRLQVRLADFLLFQGAMAEATRLLSAALRAIRDRREAALAYEVLGRIEKLLGNRATAEAALHRSLELAREVGDLNQMADALGALSDIASSWADFVEGKQYAEEALAICRRIGRPDLTARVLAALAWPVSCLGDYTQSEEYYRESLEIAEAISSPYGIALATNFLGWCAFCTGGERLPEALALHAQAMAIWRQIGQRTNLSMCLIDYALAAIELGDYATALRHAQEGVNLTVEMGHVDLTSYGLYCLGTAKCGLGDLAAAQRYLLRSLQLAKQAELPDNMMAALYFVAHLRIKEGQLPNLPAVEQMKKQSEAMELLALLIQHRATWQLFRDRALRLQAELSATLPADLAAAAIERGRRRTVIDVVAEICKDADDQGYKDDQVIGKV